MASPALPQKEVLDPYVPPAPAPSQPSRLSVLARPFSPLTSVYDRFSAWRASLGLPNPGLVENLQKEVKSTHLTNYMFDGARADLTKSLSMNPAFQVTHSFALGSQTQEPSYNFGAIFAHNTLFMQGGVDHSGNVNGRVHHGWNDKNVTKMQAQISSQGSAQSVLQVDHDYTGLDFTLNAKAINPSPTDLTGIYVGNYLQSVTNNLSLGFETLLQHPTPDTSDMSTSYVAKYQSTARDWIATAHIQPLGVLQATYWQKLSEKLDVAADLQILAAPGRREAVSTIGAKYDLRMATFRAQLDSTGKVSALLEQRFAPTFVFTVAGEIDHMKNAAKVGVGVMIESSSLTPEEMGLQPQPPF